MPSSFEKYRMVDEQTPLSAGYFNPVWQDLDVRLGDLESVRASWLSAVQEVTQLGLQRINALVGEPMETVNQAIDTLQQSLAQLPDVVLAGQLDTALQAEAQARALLAQQITQLQQAIEDVGGGDPFPPMQDQAGKFLTTDGATRAWSAVPPVTQLARGTAQPRQLLGVSAAGALVGMAPLELLDYTDRAQLRALTSGSAIVRGLGVFAWQAGSIEPDDDETCFAAAGGAWLLTAAGPDAVRALWQADVDALQAALAQHMGRFLSTTFAMTATALAAHAQVQFSVAVVGASLGDVVLVSPDAAVPGGILCMGVVTSAGGVTVSVCNTWAATTGLTPGTWTVRAIQS